MGKPREKTSSYLSRHPRDPQASALFRVTSCLRRNPAGASHGQLLSGTMLPTRLVDEALKQLLASGHIKVVGLNQPILGAKNYRDQLEFKAKQNRCIYKLTNIGPLPTSPDPLFSGTLTPKPSYGRAAKPKPTMAVVDPALKDLLDQISERLSRPRIQVVRMLWEAGLGPMRRAMFDRLIGDPQPDEGQAP